MYPQLYKVILIFCITMTTTKATFLDQSKLSIKSLIDRKKVVNLVAYIKDGDKEEFISLGPKNYSKDQRLALCSVSKGYLGTLFKILELKGLVSLDDHIDIKGRKISVSKIMGHISGLEANPDNLYDRDNPFKDFTKDHFLKNMKFDEDYIDDFAYSNQGPVVLAYYLESKLSKPYHEIVSEYLEKPLGISLLNQEDIPDGYSSWMNKKSFWKTNYILPAGGMTSTITDISIFAKYLLDNFEGKFQSQFNRDDFGVGYFWGMIEKGNILSHTGLMSGHSSYLALDFKRKRILAIMTDTEYEFSRFLNLFENKPVKIKEDFFIKKFFKKHNLK
ncbi:MAG: beta-lactamase family protein [Oligoflexia bacterium]|nr:beta-lactamase family protein [Oligoflexia bacterium]